MIQSLLIALEVFALGFVISFFIAVLIKGLMFVIRHALNKNAGKN